MPQPLSGEKRRRGRPLSGHAKDIVLHIRCTPKQKEMFLRLGGADWLRSFLDTVGEAFDKLSSTGLLHIPHDSTPKPGTSGCFCF